MDTRFDLLKEMWTARAWEAQEKAVTKSFDIIEKTKNETTAKVYRECLRELQALTY